MYAYLLMVDSEKVLLRLLGAHLDAQVVIAEVPLYSYGLYSYGLYSYGLYSYGLFAGRHRRSPTILRKQLDVCTHMCTDMRALSTS